MARLFGRKTKTETRGVSAALNPEQLRNNSEPTNRAELDRIIKTTDAMNIALSSDLLKTTETLAPREQGELNSIRDAIARSYDLARRKITTQYEQVILSNNYGDNPFLAVQVTIKNLDRNWDVRNVERVIRKFTDAIVEQIALGKTVYLNDDLIFEPLTYVDKILPTWKITPKFAILTNAIKWEQIVEELGQDGEVSLAEAKEIVREVIDAIATDVKNGYFVKVGRFIVMQLQVNALQRVLLFSNDTLERINEIHERFVKTGEQKDIRKYDALIHFDKTLENVERGFYSEDIKTPTLRPDFVPRDLTQEINVGRGKGKNKQVAKVEVKTNDKVETAKPEVKTSRRAKAAKASAGTKTVSREVAPSKTPAEKPKVVSDRKRRVGKKDSKPRVTNVQLNSVTPTVTSSAPTTKPVVSEITRKLPASPSATMKVQATKPTKAFGSATKPSLVKKIDSTNKSNMATSAKPVAVNTAKKVESTNKPNLVVSTKPVNAVVMPVENPSVAPATTEVVTTTTTTKVITTTPGAPLASGVAGPTLKSRVIKPKQKVGSFTYTNITDTASHELPSPTSVKPVKPAKSAKKRK